MRKQFFDLDEARLFTVKAMNHYQEQKAPGWFTDWLDDLYIRLGEDWRRITLDELAALQGLFDEGGWALQTLAVNTVYKLFERLGRSTVGIAGY